MKVKSYDFAIRIVKLSQYLQTEQKEFILSKQILRSGTAAGALIREAEYWQSKTDFVHKLSIALKKVTKPITDKYFEGHRIYRSKTF